MNITITFRHMDASDAMKAYAIEKTARLQRFLRKPMTAQVTLSFEKLKQSAEVRLSSGGEHYEAHEASEDIYASIDKVVDKLERQIQGAKGTVRSRARRAPKSSRRPRAIPLVSPIEPAE